MQWINQQRIFYPHFYHPFGKTRIMCPTPWRKNKDIIRLFCGFCDEKNISRPGYVDVSAQNPATIIAVSENPLLPLGQDGDFDDNGLCPTSIVPMPDGSLRMYYFGFQLLHKIPFTMFSGVAVSHDGGESFKRIQRTPVLDRTAAEPVMRSGPFVMHDEGKYKIWYPCGMRWIDVNGKKVHEYNVHYAESEDGIRWPASGKLAVDILSPDEFGLGRPYVIRQGKNYILLYSIRTRSKSYRLGYATSPDGVTWQRKDSAFGMDVSSSGWDSEMQCYSAAIETDGRLYLFYNGNNLGSSGIGYAEASIQELQF